MKPRKVIFIAALIILIGTCFRSTVAQESLFSVVKDKDAIVRAVLEAGLQRQGRFAMTTRAISTENIYQGHEIEVDGIRFKFIDSKTIKSSLKSGNRIEYLMFASFRRVGDAILVRLGSVVEGIGCFGPYYTTVTYDSYRVEKSGERWLARYEYTSVPLSPMKQLGRTYELRLK